MRLNFTFTLSWNERISSVLAILFLMVLAMLVIKITLDTSEKIKSEFAEIQAVRMDKKTNQIEEKNLETVNVPVNPGNNL